MRSFLVSKSIRLPFSAFIVASSFCALGNAAPSLTDDEILGTFKMVRNGSESTLTIVKKKNGFLNIHAEGGSDGSLEDQAPADCELNAEGAIYNNLVNAVIQDDEEANGKRTEKTHLGFSIEFKEKNRAKVLRADVETLCGVGTSFKGEYTRVNTSSGSSPLLRALESGKIHLTGKIGAKTQIEMVLEKHGTGLVGRYYYVTKKAPLSLKGTLSNGEISLGESTGDKVTGRFEGVVRNREFNGTWKNRDGKKVFPFSLTLQ